MTDFLMHMRAERTKVGEEYNRIRDKLVQYDDIVKQLEKKAIEDDLKDFPDPWHEVDGDRLAALKKLAGEEKVHPRIKFNHAAKKAVTQTAQEVVWLPYKKACEILE